MSLLSAPPIGVGLARAGYRRVFVLLRSEGLCTFPLIGVSERSQDLSSGGWHSGMWRCMDPVHMPISRGGRGMAGEVTIVKFGEWRSPVARCVRDAEVPGSNPGSPTNCKQTCFQIR